MRLVDLIPDAEVLCALEPDELGLRMLPALATLNEHYGYGLLSLERVLAVWIGNPPTEYPLRGGVRVEEAVREAWAWLEGSALLVSTGNGQTKDDRILSRRARQLASEPDARKVLTMRRIPKDSLHRSIREDVWALYHRGKYDTAVLEAMKGVEVAVREAAEFSNADYGTTMIARAFNEDNGPLRDPEAQPAERIALRSLFTGTYGAYKNPHSHRNVALDDPDEAAEIIMIANHLLRIVGSRRTALAMS